MAELNLQQITDRLNAEFAGSDGCTGRRKLVFWYDDHADFVDDVTTMELANAQILTLQPGDQFKIKYFLERQDKTTNYLVYAPFAKPDTHENHLEDLILYSKRFFADRASLLSVDLGIEERYKPIIEKYIKFFANKDRTKRFYDLEIENFNEQNILLGLMSAICKTRTCSFEEVIRVILTDDQLEENKFIAEFEKYDLIHAFWKFCEQQFGYVDAQPNLDKIVVTMFVTYAERYMSEAVPDGWRTFVSTKSGNIIAFLDSLMNNVLYRDRYDELSAYVAQGLNTKISLQGYAPEALVECDCFADVDLVILKWVRDRLLAEDTGAKLGTHDIAEVCVMRSKMHFGKKYGSSYRMLRCAYDLILAHRETLPDGFKNVVSAYTDHLYQIDSSYREFYYNLDLVPNASDYDGLRLLVENIYTNDYLGKLIPKWNEGIMEPDAMTAIPLQRNFYNRYVSNSKDRLIVIISDAMRYEVGQELFVKLSDNPRSDVKIEPMLSTLQQKITEKQAEIGALEDIGSSKIDMQKRIAFMKEKLETAENIKVFDRQVFESIVDYVIVGGYDECGNADPSMVTFVYRTGFKDYKNGDLFKPARRNAAKKKASGTPGASTVSKDMGLRDDSLYEISNSTVILPSFNTDDHPVLPSNSSDGACRDRLPSLEKSLILRGFPAIMVRYGPVF